MSTTTSKKQQTDIEQRISLLETQRDNAIRRIIEVLVDEDLPLLRQQTQETNEYYDRLIAPYKKQLEALEDA